MKYRLLQDALHGDAKTMAAFPGRWPMLKAGTVVTFIEEWTNFYGRWMKVKTEDGLEYDIEAWKLGKEEGVETKSKVTVGDMVNILNIPDFQNDVLTRDEGQKIIAALRAAVSFVIDRDEATESIWYVKASKGRILLDALGIEYKEKS